MTMTPTDPDLEAGIARLQDRLDAVQADIERVIRRTGFSQTRRYRDLCDLERHLLRVLEEHR